MSTFNWSQPIRRTQHLSDALMTTHMESGINNGFTNIYRNERKDFCDIDVFETEEEAISAGKRVLELFVEKTILVQVVAVRTTPY